MVLEMLLVRQFLNVIRFKKSNIDKWRWMDKRLKTAACLSDIDVAMLMLILQIFSREQVIFLLSTPLGPRRAAAPFCCRRYRTCGPHHRSRRLCYLKGSCSRECRDRCCRRRPPQRLSSSPDPAAPTACCCLRVRFKAFVSHHSHFCSTSPSLPDRICNLRQTPSQIQLPTRRRHVRSS